MCEETTNAQNATTYIPNIEHKLYKKRWLIMAVFLGYTINGGIQWIEYSIITDIIVKYYNVSPSQVEWTSTVSMLAYILFGLPSIYLLDKLGVRRTMVIASLGFFVGAWIKVFSVAPDRFFMLFLGQANQAIWGVMTFGLAARFTAVWFGANEISLAGALSLFGDQFGSALGFLIPPLIVKNSSDMTVIENGLNRLNMFIAIFSSVLLVLVVLFFEANPKTPPSTAQIVQREIKNKTKENTFKALMKLFRKPNFILFVESYGLCIGSFSPIATLMNQIVLTNFPNKNEDAGNIGFAIMISGMASSLIISYILDKNRLFKENAIVLTTCSCFAMILLTIALKSNNILYVYAASILFGFFVNGYYATGVQMLIEVTYPVSEGISSSTAYLVVQIHGLVFTIIYSHVFKICGDVISNIGIIVVLLISVVFTLLLPSDLKRQAVEKTATVKDGNEFI